MSYTVKLIASTVAAFFLHLLLGWAFTMLAGIVAGLWHGHGGWRLGAAAVTLDWAVWLIYSYAVDARAVHLMTQTIGSILGNMPFFIIVGLTLMIGTLLGAAGGFIGTRVHLLLSRGRGVPA